MVHAPCTTQVWQLDYFKHFPESEGFGNSAELALWYSLPLLRENGCALTKRHHLRPLFWALPISSPRTSSAVHGAASLWKMTQHFFTREISYLILKNHHKIAQVRYSATQPIWHLDEATNFPNISARGEEEDEDILYSGGLPAPWSDYWKQAHPEAVNLSLSLLFSPGNVSTRQDIND